MLELLLFGIRFLVHLSRKMKTPIPDYGLVKDFETFNPFKIFIHEYWGILKDVFGNKRSIKDRILYIVAPPGWSHDNSRKTSNDIKREYYKMLQEQKT